LLLQDVAEELVFHSGLSDFTKIVKTIAFVDKTLIKDIFEKDFVLITAPCMLGISTGLDMIKRPSVV
jgi:hypothetical protein